MKFLIYLLVSFYTNHLNAQLLNINTYSTVVTSKDRHTYTLKFNNDSVLIYSLGSKKLNLANGEKFHFTINDNDKILFSDSIQIPKTDFFS